MRLAPGAGIKVTTSSTTGTKGSTVTSFTSEEELRQNILEQLKSAGVVASTSDLEDVLMVRPDAVKAYITMHQKHAHSSIFYKRVQEIEAAGGQYTDEHREALNAWGDTWYEVNEAHKAFLAILDAPKKNESTESKNNEEHKGEKKPTS